jgi:hypothetical protein
MGLPVINEHDIEAFREDAEVFDRVNKRWLNGTTKHREMTAAETPAYMRTSMRFEWTTRRLLAEKAELQERISALEAEIDARNAVAMSPGEPEPKYGAV